MSKKKGKMKASLWDSVLLKLFDYRYVYLIRSGRSGKYKIGKGVVLLRRLVQIDRSIPGTKEKVVAAEKLFWASDYEKELHGRYENLNFTYVGTGKTEWHRMDKVKGGDVPVVGLIKGKIKQKMRVNDVKGTLKLWRVKQQFGLLILELIGFFIFLVLLSGKSIVDVLNIIAQTQ